MTLKTRRYQIEDFENFNPYSMENEELKKMSSRYKKLVQRLIKFARSNPQRAKALDLPPSINPTYVCHIDNSTIITGMDGIARGLTLIGPEGDIGKLEIELSKILGINLKNKG